MAYSSQEIIRTEAFRRKFSNQKEDFDDYPIRIEYSATDYSFGLEEVIRSMESWAKYRMKIIDK